MIGIRKVVCLPRLFILNRAGTQIVEYWGDFRVLVSDWIRLHSRLFNDGLTAFCASTRAVFEIWNVEIGACCCAHRGAGKRERIRESLAILVGPFRCVHVKSSPESVKMTDM